MHQEHLLGQEAITNLVMYNSLASYSIHHEESMDEYPTYQDEYHDGDTLGDTKHLVFL